jgi:hypothetical protein
MHLVSRELSTNSIDLRLGILVGLREKMQLITQH